MIDFQSKIMGDALRNEIFYRALKKVIQPGKTIVADIGSGTGFLSFLAGQLGAKECYLYESSEGLMELSRNIARQNKITNCHFFNVYSTDVESPVRADVVISETLGNYAYEEHIIEVLNDAKRFLKPGGVVIPQALDYWAAPVIQDRLWRDINPWDNIGYDLNFDAAKIVAFNNIYVKTIRPDEILAGKESVQRWDSIDFRVKNSSVRQATLHWNAKEALCLYGFALWWDCALLPGLSVSTQLQSPLTHWEQIYLPLVAPVTLVRGEKMTLEITSDTRYKVGLNVAWSIAIFDKQGKKRHEEKRDMKKGYLG